MPKTIQIKHLIILIVLFLVTAVSFQAQTPSENSASGSVSTRAVPNGAKNTVAPDDCEKELGICNQRLVKTLDALAQSENTIKALQAEIEARKRLEAVTDELLKTKEAVIAEQARLIEILQKRSKRKISFLFGLVKVNY